MKTKSLAILIGMLLLAWLVFFQGTQMASSSPLLRITLTPPPATATKIITLPPPPTITNPPLIPVTGTDKTANVDWLIVGGAALVLLGVVGLAWPQKRKS